MTTSVAVCGSTGSVGTQTLDVIRANPGRYRVASLAAGRSIEAVVAQADEFRPAVVAMAAPAAAAALRGRLPEGTELRCGPQALVSIAAEADVVVNAIVGFAGLDVTLATIAAGRRLGLANKESLIAAGPVVRRALAANPGAELVPIDSEHSAIHQALRSGATNEVARLLLTASGGPFRGRTKAELAGVTRDEALNHPTWSMGPKITIDSSTLMNKGLEVIEACELFSLPPDRVEVVVHPQSIVHSMVEFSDGSTIAQLSNPDMRLPIGYALAWPDRLATPFGRIDWTKLRQLDFEIADLEAFPCLALAYQAAAAGETAPAWLNAANEVAVEGFLDGRLSWADIAEVNNSVLQRHDGGRADTVEDVVAADGRARALATAILAQR